MKNKLLVIAIGLFSLILTTVAISHAQQEGASANQPSAARGRHCVAQVYEIPEGMDPAKLTAEAPAADAAAPAATCFRSFAEALQAATGATSGIDPNITPADVTDEMLMSLAATAAAAAEPTASVGPAASTVIGIASSGPNYTGATLTFRGYSVGCTTGYAYGLPVPPSGWNDVESSYRAYLGCNAVYHFEHTSYRGAVLRCNWCAGLGLLDNRTSSWQFYRSAPHY